MPEISTAHEENEPLRAASGLPASGLHKALVLLDQPRRLPLGLVALAVALLLGPLPFLFAERWIAALLLGAASAGDLALLLALPRLRRSYGPVQPAWLLFTGGRAAAAAIAGLLPLGATTAVGLLAGVQLALSAAAIWGALIEPFRLVETRLELGVPGLGGPLRALLLADLHIERRTVREERVLEAARRGRPDLILLAGDLLNLSFVEDERAAEEARAFLSQLRAPAGVLLVRGTPEVDVPEVVERILRGLKVELLDGRSVEVSHRHARLQVIGLPADRPPDELEAELSALAAVRHGGRPRLCLHHTPDLAEAAARLGLDLYVAGHTHGGQIRLPLVGPLATASRFGRRYVSGYHRVGALQAYVSRGLGLEGLGAPRLRFLAPPELVWLELRPLD